MFPELDHFDATQFVGLSDEWSLGNDPLRPVSW
jgi:hypothetical protein